MTPIEWLTGVENDIKDFEPKARSWMRPSLVANLQRAWNLTEQEANQTLEEFLASKTRAKDSRPWCDVCHERKASFQVGKQFYCGVCAKAQNGKVTNPPAK